MPEKIKNRSFEKRCESPRNILKEKYAKGEITTEEFENQKKLLMIKNKEVF
ncbi:SHOCT domain-containing protein [Gillisia sp. JM1]|uniref:SHOCT domain-containing protein n=1 Tax=Gillisia sp. JM1 TaxID=1283286 RepID=UPI0009DC1541